MLKNLPAVWKTWVQSLGQEDPLEKGTWKKSYDQPRQHIKKQKHYFAYKGPSSQGYGFSCGCAWMWELDCEEG